MSGDAGRRWLHGLLQAVRLLTSNGSSESAARSDRRESQDRAHSISFGLVGRGDNDEAAAPSWLDCLLAEDDSAASGPVYQPPEQPRASSAQPTRTALTF